MLGDYKETQPQGYRILNNALKKSKYSHAYLFETKDEQGFELIMDFAKSIICPSHKTECEGNECSICLRIDNGNYTEVVVIEPEGLQIKKESITSMQQTFSKKAVEGETMIYVIKSCEKLNKSSANTILKFLEEPEDNIVALLITADVDKVIKTIVSRCQVVKLKNDEKKEILEICENEELKEIVEIVFDFVDEYEKSGYSSIVNANQIMKYFNKKENTELVFEIMLLIYNDALKYNLKREKIQFKDHTKTLDIIIQKNDIMNVARKITVILDTKEKMASNLNSNLLLDKFLIRMDGEQDA